MTIQNFALTPGRINKFKGEILKHAVPVEVLSRAGRQVRYLPKNQSDTYVARRFLPYNATSSAPNTFFPNATGDRGNTITQAHLTQEGVTPAPESITPQDVTVVVNQYSCLYGFTDKTYDLYEDDIPKEMQIQIGERVTLVNELIIFGVLKGCTNVYYGGGGTSVATVAGGITLSLIRKIVRNLQANHAKSVTKVLKASGDFNTSAVPEGYLVYCHTDLEPDIRNLPNFTPAEKYASGTPMPYELGMCERFRFITSPELVSQQDAGAAVGATGLVSQSGSNVDVYQVVIVGADAWSQIAVRGKDSLDPTYLPPGEKSKSDPFGQRGYAGTIWWKAALVENNGWMALLHVGAMALS